MLTAVNAITKEKIFIDNWLSNLDKLKAFTLVDPFFGQPVFVRKPHFREGSLVRGHFVSKAKKIQNTNLDFLPDNDYFTISSDAIHISESFEHMEGKKEIAKYVVNKILSERHDFKIEYEHRVKITRKNKYRIIDCAILFSNGFILALECQLSPISEFLLLDRIYDYESEGIDSIWFLGMKADTELNRKVLFTHFGEIPPSILFKEVKNYETAYSFRKETNNHMAILS